MNEEFNRFHTEEIRLSLLNIDYKLCENYPCLLYFPGSVSDQVISKVADFRSKGRVPTITWSKNNILLFRSSQPKLGLGKRSADDENFFAMAKIKYVIDARPGRNAKANRLKGKGYELEDNYNINLKFMNIQNIHHVTRSYDALNELISKKDNFWLTIHDSKWMSHIILILESSICCANHLVLEKANVLIHCSDGWDRTSQISALTQILVDPFYRTIKGLQNLIKKDWLAFGHKFFDRTFGSEFSPIFVLFLDCLSQIIAQFPDDFEYVDDYLIFLADSNLQGKYGDFLCNSEKERNDIMYRTSSVWSVEISNYINRAYCPGYYKILPISIQPQHLKIWKFFTRYS